MRLATHIDDLRRQAKRRIPRTIFEYVDGGAYDERTLHENRADLARIHLRQRVMVDVSERNLATDMLGEPVAMPMAIAPTGLTGLVHPNGEIAACAVAQAFNIPYTLSTVSICSIEDVVAATNKPFWFQLYLMRDREFSRSLVERAALAGCTTLMLTLDLPVQGQRHRDIKNGLTVPPRLTFGNALNTAMKPRWVLGMLSTKRRSFGNLDGFVKGADGLTTLAQWTASQYEPRLTWQDLDWLRAIWSGKIVLKGILDVDDARTAAALGVDGILVSNHGGRQLDGALSAAAALPAIAEAVADKVQVFVDGGIRSGADVFKMLALGAHACFIGRAFLYGLGAGGEAGMRRALEILRDELDVVMALTGTTDVAQIDRERILP